MLNTIQTVLKFCAGIVIAFLVVILLSVVYEFVMQVSFRVMRENYCDKTVIVQTGESTTRITDPRPFYVCNF